VPVQGPFKELINNDCFNPEDWFTDEKVKSVTGTLRSHRLVDQVKAVEVLKDIQKAIMKREISHKVSHKSFLVQRLNLPST
jgi:hypothetical protein